MRLLLFEDPRGDWMYSNWASSLNKFIIIIIIIIIIMALIALRKLNLQTCMRSHPLALHVWFLVRPSVYFHT